MEYTPEIGLGLIVYIVLMNWVYIKEYKPPKDKRENGIKKTI